MKLNYKVLKSFEPGLDNRHYLTATTLDDDELLEHSEFQTIIEQEFLRDLIEVIENCLFLKKSSQNTGFIQTLKLYETPEGDLVEIANDDFQGIMVESENAEIINKIYERLLKK